MFFVRDNLLGDSTIHMVALHHMLCTEIQRRGDKHVDGVGKVTQHIVRTAAYKHTTALAGGLADGIALKLEQTFVGKLVGVEVGITHVRGMEMEQRTEKSLMLVHLLEETLVETTLLGCQIQYLTVV